MLLAGFYSINKVVKALTVHDTCNCSLYMVIKLCHSHYQFANLLVKAHGPEGMCWFSKSACSRRSPALSKHALVIG